MIMPISHKEHYGIRIKAERDDYWRFARREYLRRSLIPTLRDLLCYCSPRDAMAGDWHAAGASSHFMLAHDATPYPRH